MEQTKVPKFFKRHRNRGVGEKKEKPKTRQDGRTFMFMASRDYRFRATKRPFKVIRDERRAKNRRTRASRKRNR